MITAIDTNIPSALWSAKPVALPVAATLTRAAAEGMVMACGAVYAELLAYPNATQEFVDEFFRRTRVAVEFELSEEIWREAGRRFAAYCQRRRRSGAGESKRLLVDFVVGAHALVRANRLFTLDALRYRRDFPELPLI
jgi:predicted nucleic acid-binding protein